MRNPIKVGVVGLGRICLSVHLDCLRARPDKFRVVAACDLIPERCEKYAAVFGCRTYGNIADMIADPEVEVVDIATRSCDHYAHSKMALLAGKSVLVEKPFCRTYEEACELIRLGSQPSGPRIFVRHNRRFEEGFIKVNEIIDSGILGEVYEIKLTRNEYQRRNDWQTIKEFGGGQLLNWGPHLIDQALRFCGGDYKRMNSYTRQIAAAGDCEDVVMASFEGINGRIVDIEISGGVAIRQPEYIVYGTRGTLVDRGDTYSIKYLPKDYEFTPVKANPHTPGGSNFAAGEKLPFIEEERTWQTNKLDHIWQYVYDTVREGKEYPIKSEEALAVMRVITEIKRQNGCEL